MLKDIVMPQCNNTILLSIAKALAPLCISEFAQTSILKKQQKTKSNSCLE